MVSLVRMGTSWLALIFGLLAFNLGCRQVEELPTLVSTSEISRQLPATMPIQHVSPSATVEKPTTTPFPTVAPTSSPTPVVSTREPTPLPPSGVNITFPAEGTDFLIGQELTLGGRTRVGESEIIIVTLLSATGFTLSQYQAVVDEINNWKATLEIPLSVNGPGTLIAAVYDQYGQLLTSDTVTINLRPEEVPQGRGIQLYRPTSAQSIVSGYNMLFDGWVQGPVNNLVTASLYDQNCSRQAASQSFRLNGSGRWWGLLFVPNSVEGRTCAVTHFGTPGDVEWRESQVLVEVIQSEVLGVAGVIVALPREGTTIDLGRALTINGLAFNAPERLVNIALLLDNGRLITEGVVAVDGYGYWETELFIPVSAGGPAFVIASIGLEGEENYVEYRSAVHLGTNP